MSDDRTLKKLEFGKSDAAARVEKAPQAAGRPQSGADLRPERECEHQALEAMADLFWRQKPMLMKPFISGFERSVILHVLRSVLGSQRKAARILGLKFTTLSAKIKKYKIVFKRRSRGPRSRRSRVR